MLGRSKEMIAMLKTIEDIAIICYRCQKSMQYASSFDSFSYMFPAIPLAKAAIMTAISPKI